MHPLLKKGDMFKSDKKILLKASQKATKSLHQILSKNNESKIRGHP